jgi:hypothetical protein
MENREIGFGFFVVADQLSNVWVAGLLEFGLLLHCNRFLSPDSPSRRGCHRKVRSRGRSEQRPGGFLLLNFSCLEFFGFIPLLDLSGFIRYPDRSHSEIKSKYENFNSKNPPGPLL